MAFSFYNPALDAHKIVPTTITQTGENEYLMSATYQVIENLFRLRLMDIWYFGLSSTPGDGSDAYIEIDSPFAGLVKSGVLHYIKTAPQASNRIPIYYFRFCIRFLSRYSVDRDSPVACWVVL